LPRIHADGVQLQQVMLNLIVNGIQAINGVADGQRDLLITTEGTEDGVCVGVRDSGPGLSPEKLARIFEPFYTTKPNGMGMGLSICRSIIEVEDGCGRRRMSHAEPYFSLRFSRAEPKNRDPGLCRLLALRDDGDTSLIGPE
jgi:signal transduction histidine kinase